MAYTGVSPQAFRDYMTRLTIDDEGSLHTIDHVHHELHAGLAFEASHYIPDLAANATATFVLHPRQNIHTTIAVVAGGNCQLTRYEGAVITGASGGNLTAFNMNRASNTVSTTSAYHTPSGVSATGTGLGMQYIPGGAGPNAAGGAIRAGLERVYASGKVYLWQVVNITNGAIPVSWIAEWYS